MTVEQNNAPPESGIFANRTLNLRSVRAIGYDMDYTLLHYNVGVWEAAAFRHARQGLADLGWPVQTSCSIPMLTPLG